VLATRAIRTASAAQRALDHRQHNKYRISPPRTLTIQTSSGTRVAGVALSDTALGTIASNS
jgi:hypothetical protein